MIIFYVGIQVFEVKFNTQTIVNYLKNVYKNNVPTRNRINFVWARKILIKITKLYFIK